MICFLHFMKVVLTVSVLPVGVLKAGRSLLATSSANLKRGPLHGQPGSNVKPALIIIIFLFYGHKLIIKDKFSPK